MILFVPSGAAAAQAHGAGVLSPQDFFTLSVTACRLSWSGCFVIWLSDVVKEQAVMISLLESDIRRSHEELAFAQFDAARADARMERLVGRSSHTLVAS